MFLEFPWCMLNMNLHASRDRKFSPSQGGLLHPSALRSVRKLFLKVLLALPSAPAGKPGTGQGLEGQF